MRCFCGFAYKYSHSMECIEHYYYRAMPMEVLIMTNLIKAVVTLLVVGYVATAVVEADSYEQEKAAHIGTTHSQMIVDKKDCLDR